MDIASWILLMTGAVFGLLGGIGVLRMPDVYTRMHAASLIDTAGMVLMLSGLMLQAGFSLITFKLFLIAVFLLITSPTASYALARTALHDGVTPLLDRDNTQS